MARQSRFNPTVYVEATLKIKPMVDHNGYGASVVELFADNDGSIGAEASCGQQAMVCMKEELPEVIAFLQSIVDASKKKKQ